jgi:hypothetical protein
METITFRCTTCQQVLRVSADKAGRKAKCTQCGTALTIPAQAEDEPAPVPLASSPAGGAAGAPKKADDDDEGGPLTYGFKDDGETKEAPKKTARQAAEPKEKGPGRRPTKKQALITNADEWRKVGLGMRIIAGGLAIWLAAYLLARLPLLLGLGVGEEYAAAADERLVTSPVNSGKPPEFDLCSYAIALIAGNFWGTTMIWVARLAQAAMFLQYLVLVAGYAICLPVPNRFGTKLQLAILFVLAALNILFGLFFKLLPMLGLYSYAILPFVVPEIAMIEMNTDRLESLFIFWCGAPVIEVWWAIIMNMTYYLEPAMIAVFLSSCAAGLKSDELQGKAMTLMKLGFSQMFIQLAWTMAALCGTSAVLLIVLRIVYLIGMGFFIGQMLYLMATLFTVTGVVEEQLGDEANQPRVQDDEDDEDEEEDDE